MLTRLEKRLIHRKVLIIALLFGLVHGGIDGFRARLFMILLERNALAQHGLYASIISAVREVLLPILIFAALYLIGKNIDLRSSYGGVSVSLLIGVALGFFVGELISRVWWWDYWGDLLYISALRTVSRIPLQFFLGFTALALAYLRNREDQKMKWVD